MKNDNQLTENEDFPPKNLQNYKINDQTNIGYDSTENV